MRLHGVTCKEVNRTKSQGHHEKLKFLSQKFYVWDQEIGLNDISSCWFTNYLMLVVLGFRSRSRLLNFYYAKQKYGGILPLNSLFRVEIDFLRNGKSRSPLGLRLIFFNGAEGRNCKFMNEIK